MFSKTWLNRQLIVSWGSSGSQLCCTVADNNRRFSLEVGVFCEQSEEASVNRDWNERFHRSRAQAILVPIVAGENEWQEQVKSLDKMPIKRIRTKACARCQKSNDVLYRVRIDESQEWIFVCPVCLEEVKPDNPRYQYGGTWKSKKRH